MESQRIVKELESLDSEREQLEEEISNLQNESIALDKEHEEIKKRLRELEETREKQNERERIEGKLEDSVEREKELREVLRNIITRKSYFCFLSNLSEHVIALIEDRRVKGEIPAPIKKQFVKDLLKGGLCICETRLVKGEAPYVNVEGWLYKGGDSYVEDAIARLSAELDYYYTNRSDVLVEIADINKKLADNGEARRKLVEHLDKLDTEIKDIPLDKVSKLENKRDDVINRLRIMDRELGSKSNERKSIEEIIKDKQKELDRVEEENTKAVIAQQRVITAKKARDFFDEVHSLRSHDVRVELDNLIRKVFSKIDYKGYRPVLNSKFLLELRNPNRRNDLVAKSTGENQILSLSFVGALAKLARKPKEDIFDQKFGALIRFEGGNYPVVIDAAFGQLGKKYRRRVARALPSLANQVIVFVTKSQGMGSVLEELQPYSAGISVLHYRTTKEDEEEERIKIKDEEVPFVSSSTDGNEWASIDRV